MPSTIRDPESGQVKFAQDWEVDSYKEQGWTVDESATQDADGVNKNPSSGDLDPTPNVSDSKADWVAYATTQGYDDTEGLTKDELIERYG